MAYTLHAPAGSFRAFPALIAGEYNGVDITVADFDASAVTKLSPTGKAPILELPSGEILFSSHAIARFVAGIRRDTGLCGNTIQEQGAVDAWMDFCSMEIELPACVWTYPVLGYMAFDKEAYEKSKVDMAKALAILDAHLADKTYLVGDQVTLADITLCSALLYVLKLVADKAYMKPYDNMIRWFQTCVKEPEFQAVIGSVALCKKEILAAGLIAAKKAEGKKQKEKGPPAAPASKKTEQPAAPASKKTEHPYKIMDKTSPSKFSMDGWKRTYSNATSYETAMETFWKDFDHKGWSLWLQVYNHNEDNKKVFMTSNAIGGYQQRTDEIRRWAFGVMNVLGTEETLLEIKGIWLLRGDTVEHMKNANDDANWYTWTKLAGNGLAPTDEVKAQVAAYWCSENELEGKPIQDSKVFK